MLVLLTITALAVQHFVAVPGAAVTGADAHAQRLGYAGHALLAAARRLHAASDARHGHERAARQRADLLRQSLARTAVLRLGAARPEHLLADLRVRGAQSTAAPLRRRRRLLLQRERLHGRDHGRSICRGGPAGDDESLRHDDARGAAASARPEPERDVRRRVALHGSALWRRAHGPRRLAGL